MLVRNDADVMYACSGCDDGEDEVCYMMQRAAGKAFFDGRFADMIE